MNVEEVTSIEDLAAGAPGDAPRHAAADTWPPGQCRAGARAEIYGAAPVTPQKNPQPNGCLAEKCAWMKQRLAARPPQWVARAARLKATKTLRPIRQSKR